MSPWSALPLLLLLPPLPLTLAVAAPCCCCSRRHSSLLGAVRLRRQLLSWLASRCLRRYSRWRRSVRRAGCSACAKLVLMGGTHGRRVRLRAGRRRAVRRRCRCSRAPNVCRHVALSLRLICLPCRPGGRRRREPRCPPRGTERHHGAAACPRDVRHQQARNGFRGHTVGNQRRAGACWQLRAHRHQRVRTFAHCHRGHTGRMHALDQGSRQRAQP
jgi:hypothetical protein